MKALQAYFEAIIERFAKYDNLDTSLVINDVIRGMTFHA